MATKRATTAATMAGLLHDYMVSTGSTEVEVAALLGVDQTQVGRWRRGATVPRPANVADLAELLGVSAAELEGLRAASETARAERSARAAVDPSVELRKVRAELRKAEARIKRLERRLGEGL